MQIEQDITKAKLLSEELEAVYHGGSRLNESERRKKFDELRRIILSVIKQAATFSHAFAAVTWASYESVERETAFLKAAHLAQTAEEKETLAACAINDESLFACSIPAVDDFLDAYAKEVVANPAITKSFLVVMEALKDATSAASSEATFGFAGDWTPTPEQLDGIRKRAKELAVTEDEKRLLAEETEGVDSPQVEPRFILEEARPVPLSESKDWE